MALHGLAENNRTYWLLAGCWSGGGYGVVLRGTLFWYGLCALRLLLLLLLVEKLTTQLATTTVTAAPVQANSPAFGEPHRFLQIYLYHIDGYNRNQLILIRHASVPRSCCNSGKPRRWTPVDGRRFRRFTIEQQRRFLNCPRDSEREYSDRACMSAIFRQHDDIHWTGDNEDDGVLQHGSVFKNDTPREVYARNCWSLFANIQ